MLDAVHGGPDALGVPVHDFSTNANACGPCPAALHAVQQADASRYPDPHATALRRRLGDFHGVDAARIVIAASASEFITRITAAVAQSGGRRVAVPAHGYGDYARAAGAWHLDVVPEAAEADLRWSCDPSSPVGQTPFELAQRLDAWDGQGAWVLDMAYAPLRLVGAPALDGVRRERLWQMWTPNKALGLTGVRGAYAIAPAIGAAAQQARLARLAPSWPLGAHGAALLDAWTGDAAQAWLSQSLGTLRQWKAAQVALLGGFEGWTCLPGDANFLCARIDSPVASLLEGLRREGVKLRDCASFGLPGHLRLGVMPPVSQQALADAIGRLR